MNEKILSVENINKSFGGVHALKDVSMEIRAGEIHCLSGENGSGKSTIIKIISGYYKPDSGKICIDGKEYPEMNPSESINHGIQVIYQDFSLFPNLSVMENLSINAEVARGSKIINYKRMRETARQAVEKINLKVDMKAKVADLSVADKQMIAIARALVHEAKIIIMDEATASLTRNEVNSLFKVIHQLKEEGVAIVFVSHKLDEVFEISDSITIFRNGRNVISCKASEINEERFSYYMTGREIQAKQEKPLVGDPSRIRMETRNLTVEGAFEGVSLQLFKGEILGIAGQLGSGRTELAMALFGMAAIKNGEILMDGKPVNISSVTKAKQLGIGYVPEDRLTEGLFLEQSLVQNTAVTHLEKLSSKLGFYNKKAAEEETQRWIDTLSIAPDNRNNLAQKLSGGNQQKVVLAKWLACNPSILILNGPTVGVDIGAKRDIYDLLNKYASEGMSIIIASDDILEIKKLCNRVIIMKGGRINAVLCGEEVTEEALVEASI